MAAGEHKLAAELKVAIDSKKNYKCTVYTSHSSLFLCVCVGGVTGEGERGREYA